MKALTVLAAILLISINIPLITMSVDTPPQLIESHQSVANKSNYDIFVQLTDIVFEPDKLAATSELGYFRAFWGWATAHTTIEADFFNDLKKIHYCPATDPAPVIYWKGLQAPAPLIDFILGTKEPLKILEEVKRGLKISKVHNQELMLRLCELTFNPQEYAKIMKIIPEGLELMTRLHQHGHKIHVIINSNEDAWKELKNRFEKYFSHINGTVILSGQKKKARHDLLKEYIEQTSLNPETTIFIETEQTEVAHLKNINNDLKVILCKDKNFKNVYKALSAYNVPH